MCGACSQNSEIVLQVKTAGTLERREGAHTGRRNKMGLWGAGDLLGGVHLRVVHFVVGMLYFNKNFWTLKKMRLLTRCLCVYLERFCSQGTHVPLEQSSLL